MAFMWFISGTVVVSGGFFLFVVIYLLYLKWIYRNIPGPPSSFFLGNIQQLRECTRNGNYYHYLFLEWADKYGPVYKVFFFHRVMLIVTDIALVHKLLNDPSVPKSKSIYTRVSKACGFRLLGNGLVTNTDHANWKKRRGFVNPVLQKWYVLSSLDQFNAVADIWIKSLLDLTNSGLTIDLSESLSRVTLEALCQVGFGIELTKLVKDGTTFLSAINTILEAMSKTNKDPLYTYKFKNRKHLKEVRNSVTTVRQICLNELRRRMQDTFARTYKRNDILNCLLEMKENMPELTIDEILDEFVTICIAGQETTANSMSFLLMELGRNPKILSRLREELSQFVGDSNNITQDHLNRLPYMTAVINETLRMYPPAPATVRDLPKPVLYENMIIPRNSTAIIPFFVIHRMHKHFQNPEMFYPERWLEPSTSNAEPLPFLSFSLGYRMCAGKQFAYIEAKVLLSKFLHRFDFKLDSNQSFDVQEMSTLKLKGGLKVQLKCR